ncbi:MAG: O-antigen ligase family protein [Patescibacteria group bacterium]|nr:O-antigen ligase family protein [Patescibacteria group bacterium]
MFELKLEKIAKIILYAAPFLALIFIEGFYFPFMITRTVFFRLLIELGLSIYLLLLALNFKKYSPRLRQVEAGRPRFNLALGLVVIFLLFQLVAAILGYDFYKSFWSDFERMEGVISLIYLAIYLFLLQIFLKDKQDWLFYIRLILIGSVLVSLYGLVQKFDILPVFAAGVGRVASTIGNAAFLAGYLLITAGLGVYYYFNESRKNYKYLALAASGLNLIVLLLTSTRGAILGLAIGILVFILLNTIFLTGQIRKRFLVILIIIAALGLTFFLFKGKLANSKIEFIKRIATISTADRSVSNRLTVWRMALKDFKFHPYFGIGMENFEVIYNKYFTPNISENWFDRTHNVYLDELMAGGALGLAAYLAILFYLFYLLFKKRREDYWQFAVLSGLLVAYGIHNFFVFDTLNTSFIYFFLIGLIGFKDAGAASTTPPDKGGEGGLNEPNNRAFNWVFIVLLIANIFIFYKLVYLPLRINRAIFVGYYYVLADSFRSYENFKSVLKYKFGSVEIAVQLNKMNEVVNAQPNISAAIKENYYKLDREKLKFASDSFPYDIKTKIYLAQLILNNYQDIKELDEAESLLKRAIELSPNRVEASYLLYNLYAKRGEKTKARAILEDLIKELPWYGGVKIMLMSGLYKENPTRAEELYQAGIRQFGYADFGGLIKIITYLLDGKKYQEAIPYYNQLIKSESARYDYRLDLAKVYYLSGDFGAAAEQINIISSNSPETLKGYEDFINKINEAFNKK